MKKYLCMILLLQGTYFLNAQAEQLWASTTVGGPNGYGTILEGDSDGTNIHAVFSFNFSDGSYPMGRLCIATNGKIYGHTEQGGTGDSCVVFNLDTSVYTYNDIYDDENFPQYGVIPLAGMTPYTDGKFYGTCNQGGANNIGSIYTVDPSDNRFTDIYDFVDSSGGYPSNELLLAPDGRLYGAGGGGTNNAGCLFSYYPPTGQYIPLFTPPAGTFAGMSYSKLLLATDGRFYSTTVHGGTLFSFKPGDTALTIVHSFDYLTEMIPTGGVIQASNGKLYGMTERPTTVTHYDIYGEIYSYDIATDSFTVEFQFSDTTGFGPQRTLFELNNGKFIGTTMQGGAYNYGTIFIYDPIAHSCQVMLNLDSVNTGAASSADFLMTGIRIPYCTVQATNMADSFCSGSTYSFGNRILSAAGTYYDTLTSVHGCDSVVILMLNEHLLTVIWNDADTIITNDSPISLSGASPAGGTYSGPGVWNNTFYPDSAGTGQHIIAYNYTDSSGCSANISKTFSVVTGINEQTVPNQFTLFPNPADNVLFIRYNSTLPPGVRPALCDIAGNALEVVYTMQPAGLDFDISSLARGTYFVKLTVPGGAFVCKRFVKID